MKFEWPVTLSYRDISLRPLRRRDQAEFTALRMANAHWTRIGDGTLPANTPLPEMNYWQLIRFFNREAKEGRLLPWIIQKNRAIVGQLTIYAISYGSTNWGTAGYWISEIYRNQGITSTALALAVDYCFGSRQLHRIELAIRPHNLASIRIAEKLGFRYQAFLERYMHVEGDWQDHLLYALHPEDLTKETVLAQLLHQTQNHQNISTLQF